MSVNLSFGADDEKTRFFYYDIGSDNKAVAKLQIQSADGALIQWT